MAKRILTPSLVCTGKGQAPRDPYVKHPQAALNPGPFREGDHVALLWGVTPVEGVIIEDRGNIGIGGKRMYRVQIQLDDITDPVVSAVHAEDLTLVSKAPGKSRNGKQG